MSENKIVNCNKFNQLPKNILTPSMQNKQISLIQSNKNPFAKKITIIEHPRTIHHLDFF